MKFTKIVAVALACLMLALCCVACDSGDDQGAETTTPVAGESTDVVLKVAIVVKDLEGKVVYETEEYTYSGKAPNLVELIDDFIYMEYENIQVTYDELDNLQAIGTVEAADGAYWWYKLNGRDGSTALNEYIVQNGDSIEYYLIQSSSAS